MSNEASDGSKEGKGVLRKGISFGIPLMTGMGPSESKVSVALTQYGHFGLM